MDITRAAISAILAVSLAACGGGDGNTPVANNNGGGGVATGGGQSTAGCSLAERQDFVLDVMEEWYLFPDLLDTTVDPAQFNDLQSYIDALVAPARAQSRDKFFSFITSIEEENRLAEGSTAGFGIRLAYDTDANRVFILEAFENAPAFQSGIDRGAELLQIDNQTISSLMASGGPQAVINALGPSDPGVARTLSFRLEDGAPTLNSVVTKAEFTLDPISDRFGVRVLNDGTDDVGYVSLRTFFSNDAAPQLREAFQQFRDAGIDKIILDLRYNGGGFVSAAEVLGDLMADGRSGQVFSNTVLRESKSAENETRLFGQEASSISVTKLAVIATEGTASASELVTNSFLPFLGADLALIGSNTSGKPVGQFGFDRSACDDRLRAVTFQTTNADDEGEYFTGLASVVETTCRAEDDFSQPLGDAAEESISVALDFMAGRSCTPISGIPGQRTVQSVGDRMEMMQPDRPNAAQREIPGLF